MRTIQYGVGKPLIKIKPAFRYGLPKGEWHWKRLVQPKGVALGAKTRADETAWRFGALDLLRARRLARLERDFGASAEAAAVILDLLDEIERLRASSYARAWNKV